MLHIPLSTCLPTLLLPALISRNYFGVIFFEPLYNNSKNVVNRKVARRCSIKLFSKISQKSQGNTCVRVSFYDALQSDARSCCT